MMELFRNAGWVSGPLGFCSILALGVMLERLFTLTWLGQKEERAFLILKMALEKSDEAVLRDPQVAPAPVTQVIEQLLPLRAADSDSMQQVAEIAIGMQRLRLRRYLGTLATIANIAPFIGLFGTVLGVIAAFQGMSHSGLSNEAMAGGISEALSATALGLLVAIPSVIAYNFLVGRVQSMLLPIQAHVALLTPLVRASHTKNREV
jgi:biopolymer transport protein ExbB